MIQLKRVTAEHLSALEMLERDVFAHPWSAKALSILCTDTAFAFLCEQDGAVLAYGGMLTVLDEGQITNIATAPGARRRGCGAAVMEALLGEARARGLSTVTLEVRVSNLPAISLYEKFGFHAVGKRKNFYSAPVEDALLMQCDLSD